MLPCICWVIDYRGCQNVVRTSVTHSAIASHATFLFLPHFHVIWWSITQQTHGNMESLCYSRLHVTSYITWTINVLQHQVFVVLNSHKSSLFLCDLINCTDVRFLFQYGIKLRLRACYSIIRLGRSCSARLIKKSVYTSVSMLRVSTSL